ncbi:probable extracytoplasmic function alternative sigma factor [Lentisphaera araneosa HTCC2155]|jgi:RNA polymerase sigma factor (sigma-70 family)|uniref:RNA polymerase sigma factor SigS n=1 Tax=Lentisphaera araneosa HTCC2155 TaxID=313628 RepID=A6DKP5_9BACT|nr:sigma-70 family RNA polymerase sigma factor [Lentisphaera araneosa]EDM27943.1 probable extracytoplasmic function alternative sigma factor [Lentisphaera araneosa HTCC2155]
MNKDNPQHMTRATLLERVRLQHDEKSWEEFVFYYRHFIYIIARRLNLRHHDAEEITQAVLFKLWNKLPEFDYDKTSRFRSWLYLVTKNTVRDFCRKQSRKTELQDQASHSELWDLGKQISEHQIEEIAEKEWENYIYNMALENIAPSFSEKIISIFKRLAAGSLPKQLGEELDIPANTIAVYKKRVMTKLKDEVARLKRELS